MYLSIIILPLLGSIVSGFFGRKVGVTGAQIITTLSIAVTTLLAIVTFFEVGLNNIALSISLFRWVDSEWFNIMWGFQFDSLTVKYMALAIALALVFVIVLNLEIAFMILNATFRVHTVNSEELQIFVI